MSNRITILTNERVATCNGLARPTSELAAYTNAINALTTEKTVTLPNRKTDLENRVTALQAVVGDAALKTTCISAITDENNHEQSFKPSALSTYNTPHYTYIYNFNRSADSRCWGIHRLRPEAPYNSHFPDDPDDPTATTGTIGLLGDTEATTSFTKDAPSCYNNRSKAGKIVDANGNEDCSKHYMDLVDITDDDLCDDNIGTPTCDGGGSPSSAPSDPKPTITSLLNTQWNNPTVTGSRCASTSLYIRWMRNRG